MHHGVKSEGWLVTYRRGELETRQWLGLMCKTDKSRRTNAQHKHTTDRGGKKEQNKQNKNKTKRNQSQNEQCVGGSGRVGAGRGGQSISGTEST